MTVIMGLYYAISAGILAILIRNFIDEKDSAHDAIHYLIVMIPLVLRLLRVK